MVRFFITEILLPESTGKTIQAATIPWALNYYTEGEFTQHINQRIDLASSWPCVPPYKCTYGSWDAQHTCTMLSGRASRTWPNTGQNGKNPPKENFWCSHSSWQCITPCLILSAFDHIRTSKTGIFSSACTVPLVKDRNNKEKLTLQPHLSVLFPHPPSINGGSLRSSGQTAPVCENKGPPTVIFQSRVVIAVQQFGVCCRSAVAAVSTGKKAELL